MDDKKRESGTVYGPKPTEDERKKNQEGKQSQRNIDQGNSTIGRNVPDKDRQRGGEES